MSSRHELRRFTLKKKDDGEVYLRIQPGIPFCALIEESFPSLRHQGWHDAESSARYTYVPGMSDADFSALTAFLKLFDTGIVLTPSEHLSPFFTNEIDHCMALDWTFPRGNRETRTPIYQFVYDVKYNPNSSSRDKRNKISQLAAVIVNAVRSHPLLMKAHCICPVPSLAKRGASLPGALTEIIGPELNKHWRPIMRKTKVTQKIKDVPLERKHIELSNCFEVIGEIRGQEILLIDDIYESGMTLWSVAHKLKESGVAAVYGLACVKTWRDTDNL